jgi:hypothetical protein
MACYDVISQIVANHIFGDSSSDETVDEELSDTETLLTFHVSRMVTSAEIQFHLTKKVIINKCAQKSNLYLAL